VVWVLNEVLDERAENGCFIRTIPTRNSPAAWINMVANFNLTWKTTCLEILHYVSSSLRFHSFLSLEHFAFLAIVHRKDAWVICRGTRGVDRMAILDGPDA
jgi:hypothetical protein